MKTLRTLVAAAAVLTLSGAAQAALVARSGGMVYDSMLDITWLADWNTNGLMNWTTANDWANNLVFGGFDDWRLPTSLNVDGSGPCSGYNCTGSEMGHMFYDEFDATAGSPITTGTNQAALTDPTTGLFTNVRPDEYWSGTEYARNPGRAWGFATYIGLQGDGRKIDAVYAVAVRPGDVGAPVPEPQTLALVVLALGATVVARRRRPA